MIIPNIWYAGWWFQTFVIFSIYSEQSPKLTFIFFRGRLNHQPDRDLRRFVIVGVPNFDSSTPTVLIQ